MHDAVLCGTESILTARAGDLEEVRAFAAICPEAPDWPQAAWASFMYPETPQTAAEEPGMCRRLFVWRSPRAAFCGLIAVALLEETTELELLMVHPERRRGGVGRGLGEHWLRWATNAGAREAVLEVRSSNAGAQALYRALGFESGGTRAGYYRHPKEDALLMRRPLGEVKPIQASPPATV